MDSTDQRLSRQGYIGLLLSIAGFVLPAVVFLALNKRYENDLVWQEGGAVIPLVGLSLITVVCEITALVLGIRAISKIQSRISIALAILILAVIAWYAASLLGVVLSH